MHLWLLLFIVYIFVLCAHGAVKIDDCICRETLAKLKAALEEAKQLKTKAGPSPHLIGAQSSLNQMTFDLTTANSEVSCLNS